MQTQLVSINGKGVVCHEEGSKRKRESSPLSNLELGIGCSGGLSRVIQEEDKQVVFTAEQFQEFYLQVVIFSYILSGLPVPIHLVLPVWKSLATSLSSSKSGIYRQFPSFLGFTIRDIEYRRMMDSEPGRCRRTDGKKWRCYRDVVPHQKYCGRHMHRGCQRSRKHVEISENTLKSNTLSINSNNFASSVISFSAAATDSNISASISTSLNLTVSCSNAVKIVPGTSKCGSASYTDNGNWENKGVSGTTSSSLVRVLADKDNTKYEINHPGGKGLNFNHIHTSKTDCSSLGRKNYCDASVAPIFCLSPKSVLQGGKAAGCNRLNFDSKALAESEPLRCRRTDGKKWRCSRDVVHDKKYCETHLHRGAKKATVDPKLVTGTPAEPTSRSIDTCCASTKVDNVNNLNTNLSLSMLACPQKTPDIDSSSFSISDDPPPSPRHTMTDENASIARVPTRSP